MTQTTTEAPISDVYEIEITANSNWDNTQQTGSALVSHDNIDEPVVIGIEEPSRYVY